MGICVSDVAGAVQRALQAMADLEQVLNKADSQLGDGDTGSMLARLIKGLAEVDLSSEDDVGSALNSLSLAAMASTGSSLGTLVGAALMAVGKKTRGQSEVDWANLSDLLDHARVTMTARGRANLGDKTVLDGLDALANATATLSDPAVIADASASAVDDALAHFRGRECRIGRARMFAEKSAELDDPGMLALARLTQAVARRSPTVK